MAGSHGIALTWIDGISLGVVVAQSLALAASLVFAYLTVRESRAARKDEAARFDALQQKDRAEEREARLLKIVHAIADYEDVRGQSLTADAAAWHRAGPMRVRLRAAIVSTGQHLPATRAYFNASEPFAPLELLQPALDELENSLGQPSAG